MKTQAEFLIESLTSGSGRTVFTTKETKQLVEITYLECNGDLDTLNNKVESFKNQYVLKDEEWIKK
jgi:hypothetical protein